MFARVRLVSLCSHAPHLVITHLIIPSIKDTVDGKKTEKKENDEKKS